jgi:hypothetical protein
VVDASLNFMQFAGAEYALAWAIPVLHPVRTAMAIASPSHGLRI